MLGQIVEYWNIFVDLINRYVIGVVAEMKLVDLIDIVILSIILFYVYKFIRQRRAVRLARGVIILTGILLLSVIFDMRALNFILENFFQVGMIAIIVIFQSDLRAALERFGSTKISDFRGVSENDAKAIINVAEVISEAAESLAKTKTGALIVVERSTKLGEHLSHGVILNADMSALLIRNIFFDKAPMHDGAMIIRSKRVYAAGCYLPLSNADVNKDLGTRHRAALGLSEVSDAIVIVISEETGTISIAFDGELVRGFDAESLKAEILKYTLPSDMPRRAMAELGVTKKIINKKAKKSKNKEEENE
ncbi:MAG: diadenylate cyclase CdaA [Clostridia bacterium]|nr:diadenylate cyclase CdaA [Clostridia bacterium]